MIVALIGIPMLASVSKNSSVDVVACTSAQASKQSTSPVCTLVDREISGTSASHKLVVEKH